MKCFYCSNPINTDGRFVNALVRHNYKDGSSRESYRSFHCPCLSTFQVHGRPLNPHTGYEVLWTEDGYDLGGN